MKEESETRGLSAGPLFNRVLIGWGFSIGLLFLLVTILYQPAFASEEKLVIAHRGASGYLPEHTLEAKALAYGMGADFIEQDVVLTRDNVPIVIHDIHLDTVTDVAKKFPNEARKDGRYYAIDFTLKQIKKLSVTERIDSKTNKAVYPHRFPVGLSAFKIPTLAEEIELIQGLNRSTGRNVGIYPEIKSPAWHRKQGKDISKIVLTILQRYGYVDENSKVYLQCFDAEETKRIRYEFKSKLKLIQLLGENDWGESDTDYTYLKTKEGLHEIAQYANGIGPWIQQIVEGVDTQGNLKITPLVKEAHAAGLLVHPYTFRADSLPNYANSLEQLLCIFYFEVSVSGLFTDFPDRAVKYLNEVE